MKKIVSLLLVFLLSITIIGCENKKEKDTKKEKSIKYKKVKVHLENKMYFF